jgi:DNA-binding NarL/FixJ family response regulator
MLRTHPQLFERLLSLSSNVYAAAHWEEFLRLCDDLRHGVVLLDLDEAERSEALRQLGISAHRLVTLLADQSAKSLVALVLVTSKDYAEVEDLVKRGVHALLHPCHDAEWCVEQVRAALQRKQIHAHAASRSEKPAETQQRPRVRLLVPVPETADVDLAARSNPAADSLTAYN